MCIVCTNLTEIPKIGGRNHSSLAARHVPWSRYSHIFCPSIQFTVHVLYIFASFVKTYEYSIWDVSVLLWMYVQWINVHVLVLGLCVFTRSSVHCTPSPLQDCTTALLHPYQLCTTTPLQNCNIAPIPQCTTELLRYCTIASRHRCTTTRLHRCITVKPPNRSIAPRHLA
jgi:hypothetical protein